MPESSSSPIHPVLVHHVRESLLINFDGLRLLIGDSVIRIAVPLRGQVSTNGLRPSIVLSLFFNQLRLSGRRRAERGGWLCAGLSWSCGTIRGMAKRVQVAIDCADPVRLARFWADVLNYQVQTPPAGYQSWSDYSRAVGANGEAWAAVIDPEELGPRVLFHKVPESKAGKNRVHLDVRLVDARQSSAEQRRACIDAEVSRLLHAGATHVRTDEDEADYFAVMQDPEGNEFCVG